MHLQWQPVGGAIGYYVEFRIKNGKSLFTRTISESKIDVKLRHGEYQYRIAIIYKNNNISDWSDWFELAVVPLIQPEIDIIDPDTVTTKQNETKVFVRGRNFLARSKIFLLSGREKNPVEAVEYIDDKTLLFRFRPGKILQGEYDLEVENPGGLKSLRKNSFFVESDIKPVRGLWGIEGGYNISFANVEPAYSGSAGGSLFYENHSPGKSLTLLSFMNNLPGVLVGAKISYYWFLSPAKDFGRSDMLQGMLYCGYDFGVPYLKGLSISPFIGYKQYYRRYIYRGREASGSRPVISSGLNINYDLTRKIVGGFVLEHNYFLEVNPVQTLGIFIRAGYRI